MTCTGIFKTRGLVIQHRLLLLAASITLLGFQSVDAAAFTWDGGGTDSNWLTAKNWSPDGAPATNGTASLIFAVAATRLTANNNSAENTAYTGITFTGTKATGSTFLLTGNKIRLAGDILVSSTGGDFYGRDIQLAMDLTATRTINADTNHLRISGNIGETVSSGINITGGCNVNFSGTNTYTGATAITAAGSSLTIMNASALGGFAAGQGTTVASGTTLYLQGNTTFNAEPLSISGTNGNINGAGALCADSGSNTWTGLITLAAESKISAIGGHDLTLDVANGSNAISGNFNLQFVAESGSVITIKDPIATGANTLTKVDGHVANSGTGDLVLTAANTYTGTTTISIGSLQLGDGGSTGSLSTSSSIVNNGNLTIKQSDTVVQGTDFSAAAITGTGTFTQAGTGTTTLSATHTYSGATAVHAGILNVTGSLAAASTVTVGGSSSNGTPTLAGTGTIKGATTIATAGGGAAGIHSPGIRDSLTGKSMVGTQTFSSTLSYGSGSIFEWDLRAGQTDPGEGAVNSGSFDQVSASGAVTGTAAVFKVALGTNSFTDAFWSTNKSWDVFTTGAGSNNLSTIFSSFTGTGIGSSGLVKGQGYNGLFSFLESNSTLYWTRMEGYEVVPEPGTSLAGLLLAAGLLRRKR